MNTLYTIVVNYANGTSVTYTECKGLVETDEKLTFTGKCGDDKTAKEWCIILRNVNSYSKEKSDA